MPNVPIYIIMEKTCMSQITHHETVGWVSLAQISQPLNTTDQHKWHFLQANLAPHIHVVAFSTSWRAQYAHDGANFYLLPYVPFAPVRYAVLVLGIFGVMLWLIVRHNLALVVAQSPYDGAIVALAILCAKLFGKKTRLVIEAHDDFANKLFLMRRVPFEPIVKRIMARVARWSVRRANALRSVSISTEKQLSALAPTTPHVRFTAWTDASAFSDTPRTVSLTTAQTIVYVGVITPVKGIHVLIEAIAKLPAHIPVLLIGAEVAPRYSTQLRERIQALGLTNITWLGKLPQPEVAQHVANARLLVLPSQSEGLPRVIIEAMLCGTPVVATAVDGIPDIITHGETGFLVPTNDSDALYHALQTVLNADIATLERITRHAQTRAQDIFSPQAYLDGYRRLFGLALA
jgi:glycosyltransferase involved in cell wall biosynthesis